MGQAFGLVLGFNWGLRVAVVNPDGFSVPPVSWDESFPGPRRLTVQFVQESLCVFQVGGVEAFGEPAVTLGEHGARLVASASRR